MERGNTNQPKNHRGKTANIFDLIKEQIPVSMQTFRVSNDFRQNLALAKNLLHFLNEKAPKEVSKIEMNPASAELDELNGELANILFNQNGKIQFIDNHSEEDTYLFLEPTQTSLQMHAIEAKYLYTLPTTPLRIGLAYLLQNLMGTVTHALEQSYENEYSTVCGHLIDCYRDMNAYEGGASQKQVENLVNKYLRRGKKALRFYQKYIEMDIEIFNSYNPKNPTYKKIKKAIQGLSVCRLEISHHFAESDGYENGYASFRDFNMVVIDLSEEICFDLQFLEDMVNNANQNGWTEPMAYTKYTNTKYEYAINKKDIKDLQEYENAMDTLIETLQLID